MNCAAPNGICSRRREEADGCLFVANPPPHVGGYKSARSVQARERAMAARAALADCRLCAHECGVNRLVGNAGLCHAGAEARVFSAQVEVSDELELIPTFAIALSGCDLRCDFCITGAPSWNPRLGEPLRMEELIERANVALANGARTVMILGGEPAIHLPTALEIVAALSERRPPARHEPVEFEMPIRPDDTAERELQRAGPEAGAPKLVWKTNAHGSAQARELLAGMFDVWLADYKFGNDACAVRLARVSDYVRVVRENLLWFAGQERRAPARHKEYLTTKKQSNEEQLGSLVPSLFNQRAEAVLGARAGGELIVRHLLMPGHVECCWRQVAEWLAENLPGVKVNLRSGFWPAWHAARHGELRGTVTKMESEIAQEIAGDFKLNLVK